MAENGQYKFSIGLDNKQLEMDIAQAKKAFDSLVKQAKEAGAKIDGVVNPFEQIGKNAPQVAQAAEQFNGLNVATQQLVRELPAASMGLNTFFLAVSNNLPILADQIKQVNEENKNLAAQGKPTTSVLEQIAGSLFSWQTALVLGVTALSMYGKEIGKWVVSLFKGKEAIDAAKEATDGLNAAIEKNGLGIGKELGKYESLRREFESINGDLKEQERFVRDNQSAFDDLGVSVNSVVDAEAFFSGQGTEAFLTALRLRAEALAAQKLAVEQYEKAIIAETEASKLPEKIITSTTPIYARTRTGVVTTGYKVNTSDNPERKKLEAEAKSARSVADAYFDMHDAKMKAAGDTLEDANIKQKDKQTQEELLAAELRAKQIANTSARLVADATKAKTQAEIDAMAEGLDKKIAQINLDYDLEEQAITKREEELRKLRGGMLTKQEEDAIAAMRSANKANKDRDINAAYASESARIAAENKKRQEAWNEYLIQYGTFKEKQKAITDKYNAEIADAETEGERMALEAERDAILAEFAVEAEGFGKELAAKSAEEIDKLLTDLKGQVDAKEAAFNALDSSESADATQYQNEINELRAKIKLLEQAAGKAKKEVNNKDWDESVQTFQNIANSAMEAADGIAEFDEDLGNSLRSIAQLASSGLNLVVVIKKITDAAWTGAAAISAMEKASLILTAISAGIQVVSTLFNLFRQSDEVEETKRQFKELNDELVRLHKLARIDSVEGTIFGPNPFGNFINNLKAMQDALKDFEASKEAIMKQMHGDIRFGNDGKPVMEINPYGNLKDAISNMRVKTKDRNWFGELFNGGDEYADLGDYMPDLFDEFGDVTLEGLQSLQNSDVWEKLGEKDRELIEQMIADWEDYNAAVEATNKYLSGAFGDLGYTMTNALVDAFENGTDAAQAFGEAASDVIEKLATDMIHAALVQPILDKYQQLIDEANLEEMSPEERIAELTRLIGEMSQEVLAVKGEVDATAAQVRQDAEDAGITGVYDGSSSSSATSKGFQTMSQETGSELNGRFTDIQGQTHRIAEAVEFNKGMQQQQVFFLQSVSETLAAIHTNTDSIEKHTRTLARIDANINSMRRTMDNGGGL